MEKATDRLRIRDIALKDLEPTVALWTEPSVRRGMGDYGPAVRAEVQAWIREAIRHNEAEPRRAHNCVVTELASGNVVGWIGFGPPSRSSVGDIDFGFSILPEYRRRGYATEALRAVIAFCLDELGAASVCGRSPERLHVWQRWLRRPSRRRSARG